VTIRAATSADLPALEQLWRAFFAEVPEAPWRDVDPDVELREIAEIVAGEIALIAEDDEGAPAGFVFARRMGPRLGRLTDLYVAPSSRNRGVASGLVLEVVGRLRALGLDYVELEVTAANSGARVIYERWGFREDELTLVAPLDVLDQRLAPKAGASSGAVYVQTDDSAAVERAVSAFAPRIGSSGSTVDAPVGGWIAVRDEVASREPDALRRLARELSDRSGAVVILLGIEDDVVVRLVAFERGTILDEYLSVPEYHGALPPGDVIALAANPTVLARLTGAEHSAIRAAAATATTPTELPPAAELAAKLAAVLGLPPLAG
jgi:ribosomal protein S18 acetylase RimI-like enzyme